MVRRHLPIGIQDFSTIRGDNFYYVDKTPLIHRLVSEGRYYFLSRPRRFGKSLLVDTLRQLFAGKRRLFRGLVIHDHWDWTVTRPVVRLSFDGKYNEPGNLDSDVASQLEGIEEDAEIEPSPSAKTGPERFRSMLQRFHRITGRQVVVLVDEYDKPILDVLDNPELAKANRDYLRGLYGIVRGCAEHVRFVFVTGVSMFSKVSLFCGLNNLLDISLDPRFATICGFTDSDLDAVFAPELPGLDREQVRHSYNGYHWGGEEKLYNPLDMLLLFRNRKFDSHWYETGTPKFLHHLMVERNLNPLQLENRLVAERRLSRFDVDDIDPRALMFQAGYLTIVGEERRGTDTFFALEFPNLEVRRSFNQDMLAHLGQKEEEVSWQGHALLEWLEANDFDGFAEQLRSHLAGIPDQWRLGGDLGRYESHYAAMLYMTFCAVAADVRAEESSSRGRADMVLRHGGQVFVLELKMAEGRNGAGAAATRVLSQMRSRGYGEKYGGRGEPIHLVGVVFGRKDRDLLAVRAERC
ncbi:MAG: AAA family ATPase [Bryobacterales bacterium]|nr:AAA family ATPase [Bryobacterales bacterium]